MMHMRHLARINPPTPALERLPANRDVTFHPLETVWADGRADRTRTLPLSEASSGFMRFEAGDVLLPKTAPTFQHARTMLAEDFGVGSTELHVLRPRPGVDGRWLAYLLRSRSFIAEGVSAYQGVAGLQRVSQDFVAAWPVPAMTVETQQRVADFLDEQVGKINAATRARVRQRLAIRERVASCITASLPQLSTWNVPLKRVVHRIVVGIVVQPATLYSVSGMPFLRGVNLKTGTVNKRDLRFISIQDNRANSRSMLRADDVLVARVGITGTAARVPEWAVGGNCVGMLVIRTGPADAGYIEHLINTPAAQEKLRLLSGGSLQEVLNAKALAELRVPMIDVRRQGELARLWGGWKEQLAEAERLLQASELALEERKQALITAAVTGEFDVTTASARAVA